jgi:hypothetical protein
MLQWRDIGQGTAVLSRDERPIADAVAACPRRTARHRQPVSRKPCEMRAESASDEILGEDKWRPLSIKAIRRKLWDMSKGIPSRKEFEEMAARGRLHDSKHDPLLERAKVAPAKPGRA